MDENVDGHATAPDADHAVLAEDAASVATEDHNENLILEPIDDNQGTGFATDPLGNTDFSAMGDHGYSAMQSNADAPETVTGDHLYYTEDMIPCGDSCVVVEELVEAEDAISFVDQSGADIAPSNQETQLDALPVSIADPSAHPSLDNDAVVQPEGLSTMLIVTSDVENVGEKTLPSTTDFYSAFYKSAADQTDASNVPADYDADAEDGEIVDADEVAEEIITDEMASESTLPAVEKPDVAVVEVIVKDEQQPYRTCDDDIDTSSDSTSSSDSSVLLCSDAGSDGEEEDHTSKRRGDSNKPLAKRLIRTKGELLLEDLPPIADLQITVSDDVQMQRIGKISSVVGLLVVVQAFRDSPALDEDTILFLEGKRVFGQIFETFGPVVTPFYSVRFNSAEHIESHGVELGADIYYVPNMPEWTHYVFMEHIKKLRGCDASWEDNNEPPSWCIEYSDDEEERRVKAKRRELRLAENGPAENDDDDKNGENGENGTNRGGTSKRSRRGARGNSTGQRGGGNRQQKNKPAVTSWPPSEGSVDDAWHPTSEWQPLPSGHSNRSRGRPFGTRPGSQPRAPRQPFATTRTPFGSTAWPPGPPRSGGPPPVGNVPPALRPSMFCATVPPQSSYSVSQPTPPPHSSEYASNLPSAADLSRPPPGFPPGNVNSSGADFASRPHHAPPTSHHFTGPPPSFGGFPANFGAQPRSAPHPPFPPPGSHPMMPPQSPFSGYFPNPPSFNGGPMPPSPFASSGLPPPPGTMPPPPGTVPPPPGTMPPQQFWPPRGMPLPPQSAAGGWPPFGAPPRFGGGPNFSPSFRR